MRNKTKIEPIHPGEILLEEFIRPFKISQYKLAKDTGLPLSRINQIILGKRIITAETALLLSKYFNLSEDYWLNLQKRYDLEIAKEKMIKRINSVKTIIAAV
ncbi:MAG: HigA family addiction module antitoxin [Ignavibacteriales bacterium]|nr:HigA family addiction module antitoxin [Ignavibacteriales bacterium]